MLADDPFDISDRCLRLRIPRHIRHLIFHGDRRKLRAVAHKAGLPVKQFVAHEVAVCLKCHSRIYASGNGSCDDGGYLSLKNMGHRIDESVGKAVAYAEHRVLAIAPRLIGNYTQTDLPGIDNDRRLQQQHKADFRKEVPVCGQNIYIVKLPEAENPDLAFGLFNAELQDSPHIFEMRIPGHQVTEPAAGILCRGAASGYYEALFVVYKRIYHRQCKIRLKVPVEGVVEDHVLAVHHLV